MVYSEIVAESNLTLILVGAKGGGEGGNFIPSSVSFPLITQKTVKAVTLTSSRDEFGIPKLPQSPDIGQNSAQGISNLTISGQSLTKLKLPYKPNLSATLP